MNEPTGSHIEGLDLLDPADVAIARREANNPQFEARLRLELVRMMPDRAAAMRLADQFLKAMRS